jgi:D-alanyl-lipoteichoic acid acyltransferase DltB (MBOAT superfamily)
MVIMIIYSGYLLIVDGWKWENFKKAKNNLINILLAIIALFFFLFILYQIFAEFGGNS